MKRSGSDGMLLFAVLALTLAGGVAIASTAAAFPNDPLRTRYFGALGVGWVLLLVLSSVPLRGHFRRANALLVAGLLLLALSLVLSRHSGLLLPVGYLCLIGAQCARSVNLHSRPFIVEMLLAFLPLSLILVTEMKVAWLLVYGWVVVCLWFLEGVRARYLLLLGLLSLPTVFFIMVSFPYRRARLLAFLSPADDPTGSGYQLAQSLIAVGSGSLTGEGFAEGVQRFWVPRVHSDFVFAHLGEEFGLLGLTALVIVFAVVLWRSLRLFVKLESRVESLWAAGIGLFLVVRFLLHAGFNTAVLPVMSVPMPVVSYGRAVIVDLAAVGILLNLSRATGEHVRLGPRIVSFASAALVWARARLSNLDSVRFQAGMKRAELVISLITGLITLALVLKGFIWWLLN